MDAAIGQRPQSGRYVTQGGESCWVNISREADAFCDGAVRVHFDDGSYTNAFFRTFAQWGYRKVADDAPAPSAHRMREDESSAPVLFLGIDGVLNSRECWKRLRGSRHKIDREKVALLNDVVAATGCRIVVSSVWRFGCGMGKDGDRPILRRYGLIAHFHRAWRTPRSNDGVRGDEIAEWLQQNGSPAYAIVDDDSDMLESQMPRFVQTTFATGLGREHADRLIALLRPLPASVMMAQPEAPVISRL